MRQDGIDGYVSYSCDDCDETFDSLMGVRVHAGKKHGVRRVTVRCDNCGEPKEVPAFEARQYRRHYCDATCKGEAQKPTRLGQQSFIHVCEWCGDAGVLPLQRVPETTRFCSKSCHLDALAEAARHRTGSDHPAWKGGVSTYLAIRRCLGDRSWAYIADDYRESVGRACEWCGGTNENGRALDVHHIVPIRTGGIHDDDLLMALCRSCHSKADRFVDGLFGSVVTDGDGSALK